MTDPQFSYEPPEAFGEGLTKPRPWNVSALQGVERLNGRAAMVGFAAAVIIEWLSGKGISAQLLAVVQWYLQLG